jgi:hypothetical protein
VVLVVVPVTVRTQRYSNDKAMRCHKCSRYNSDMQHGTQCGMYNASNVARSRSHGSHGNANMCPFCSNTCKCQQCFYVIHVDSDNILTSYYKFPETVFRFGFSGQIIFIKIPNSRFYRNRASGIRACTCGQTDGNRANTVLALQMRQQLKSKDL